MKWSTLVLAGMAIGLSPYSGAEEQAQKITIGSTEFTTDDFKDQIGVLGSGLVLKGNGPEKMGGVASFKVGCIDIEVYDENKWKQIVNSNSQLRSEQAKDNAFRAFHPYKQMQRIVKGMGGAEVISSQPIDIRSIGGEGEATISFIPPDAGSRDIAAVAKAGIWTVFVCAMCKNEAEAKKKFPASIEMVKIVISKLNGSKPPSAQVADAQDKGPSAPTVNNENVVVEVEKLKARVKRLEQENEMLFKEIESLKRR